MTFYMNLVLTSFWISDSIGQGYEEYLNENYTIFSMIDNPISWSAARNICQLAETDLASFTTQSETDSSIELIKLAELEERHIWIGLYDFTEGNSSTSQTIGWGWIDGNVYNISKYNNWEFDQPNAATDWCGFYRKGDLDGKWFDGACDGTLRVSSQTVADTILCDTSSSRNYSLSLTLGNNIKSSTNSTIYFQIQGEIVMTNNYDQQWTEWFSYNGFNIANTTYSWNQRLLSNVGPPMSIIILSQQSDNILIKTISVDNKSYIFNGDDINIVYNNGQLQENNGCSYIIVNFTSNNYTDETTTYIDNYNNTEYKCPYYDDLHTQPPTQPLPSKYPSNVPSNSPSMIPSNAPPNTPLNTPSQIPSESPILPHSTISGQVDNAESTEFDEENDNNGNSSNSHNDAPLYVVIIVLVIVVVILVVTIYIWYRKNDKKKYTKVNKNDVEKELPKIPPANNNTTNDNNKKLNGKNVNDDMPQLTVHRSISTTDHGMYDYAGQTNDGNMLLSSAESPGINKICNYAAGQTKKDGKNDVSDDKHKHSNSHTEPKEGETQDTTQENKLMHDWFLDLFKNNESDGLNYFDMCIKNGFDEMTELIKITDKELEQIGIAKLGHRKKILQALIQHD